MTTSEMRVKIAGGNGFIAALDQSGGSTPKALQGYGYRGDEWSNDEEMFGLIHQMRSRIITAPTFGGGKIIGAILFERTMDGDIGGKPVPQALVEQGVVPFIKIDKGLEDEADGVQMMKPMPELDALLTRARALGVFGTKERSVINLANPDGVTAVVEQQFNVAAPATPDAFLVVTVGKVKQVATRTDPNADPNRDNVGGTNTQSAIRYASLVATAGPGFLNTPESKVQVQLRSGDAFAPTDVFCPSADR